MTFSLYPLARQVGILEFVYLLEEICLVYVCAEVSV